MESTVDFLKEVLRIIAEKDPFHMKTLKRQVSLGREFNELKEHICTYFETSGIEPSTVASDYLRMIGDMRREGGYFIQHDSYSCKNQAEAYQKVYSKPDVMRYYMNALLISQLLWKHHFNMLKYFRRTFDAFACYSLNYRVLDIGAGHGLFSWIIKTRRPNCARIDIVDLSDASLEMTRKMVGEDDVHYLNQDISEINTELRYELIIIGEVLEHLDDPISVLKNISGLLSERGLLFFTVPTNAPAIDHVYLFRTKEDVLRMIDEAGLGWLSMYTAVADFQTQLIGAFCIKK